MVKRISFFIVLFLSALLIPLRVNAQEKIENFLVKIQIDRNGKINVMEEIKYDFGSAYKHGIYRDIPLIKENREGDKFKIDVENISVNDNDGNQYQYEISKGRNLSLKIGNPNKTITGKNVYIINYMISGALTYFDTYDELYWNAIGTEWKVPIENAFIQIIVPEDIPSESLKYVCYTGTRGSTEENCAVRHRVNNLVIYQSIGTLNPREGMTVVLNFPTGYVEKLYPKKDSSDLLWAIFGITLGLMLITLNLIIPGIKVADLVKQKANLNKKQKIVAAWFDPPKKKNGDFFSPAETLGILKGKIDHHGITAEIIKLAQMGYLKIISLEKKNFNFIKLKDSAANLSEGQQNLLNAFFHKKNEIDIKELKKSRYFGGKIEEIKKNFLGNLDEEGIYSVDINKLRTKNILISVFSLFIGGVVNFAVYLYAAFKEAPRTGFGIDAYSKARSLLNFLQSQDKQLDFQAEKQMFFEKLLSYATAFGVEDVWIKRFSDIMLTNLDWYEGNISALQTGLIASSLNSGIKGASATASRSSSGFSSGSSGGSSGGGGGGGGGGSW